MPRRAMVLGAGLGQRMRPLTLARPKPLVELAGKPLIDHALDALAAAGVEEAVVNVHYLADLLEAHVAARRVPRMTVSDERALLLDTGGGIARALPVLGKEPFFLINSDTVWIDGPSPALMRLARAWRDGGMDALLLLIDAGASLGYAGSGDFLLQEDGRLRRKDDGAGGEQGALVYIGTAILHPRLFDGAPSGPFSLNRLFDRAIAEGRLFGLVHDGFWMHVGTPAALDEAQAWMAAREAGGQAAGEAALDGERA